MAGEAEEVGRGEEGEAEDGGTPATPPIDSDGREANNVSRGSEVISTQDDSVQCERGCSGAL